MNRDACLVFLFCSLAYRSRYDAFGCAKIRNCFVDCDMVKVWKVKHSSTVSQRSFRSMLLLTVSLQFTFRWTTHCVIKVKCTLMCCVILVPDVFAVERLLIYMRRSGIVYLVIDIFGKTSAPSCVSLRSTKRYLIFNCRTNSSDKVRRNEHSGDTIKRLKKNQAINRLIYWSLRNILRAIIFFSEKDMSTGAVTSLRSDPILHWSDIDKLTQPWKWSETDLERFRTL